MHTEQCQIAAAQKEQRAEQGRQLEAELIALVKQHGFILTLNPGVKKTFGNVAAYCNFSQLKGMLK